jgi:hypothetical protein
LAGRTQGFSGAGIGNFAIRDAVYFLGVIDEFFDDRFPDGYLEYLRYKTCMARSSQIKPHQSGTDPMLVENFK